MNKRRLVYSIVQFLNRELASEDVSEDAKEGLEVASQCMQTAFCLAPEDAHLEVTKPLEDIFNEATKNEPVISNRVPIFHSGLNCHFLMSSSCRCDGRRHPRRPKRTKPKN